METLTVLRPLTLPPARARPFSLPLEFPVWVRSQGPPRRPPPRAALGPTSVRFLPGSPSLWGCWDALIELLSLRHEQRQAPRAALGLQQKRLLGAVARWAPGASLSAGPPYASFLFVFLGCGSGSCPLAAPASSGCVPPAPEERSRISRAHYGKGHQKHRDTRQGQG